LRVPQVPEAGFLAHAVLATPHRDIRRDGAQPMALVDGTDVTGAGVGNAGPVHYAR
jgi:hypothetical protein